MFDQWKWVDLYGRVHGSISGFTAFAQGKPDKLTNYLTINYDLTLIINKTIKK